MLTVISASSRYPRGGTIGKDRSYEAVFILTIQPFHTIEVRETTIGVQILVGTPNLIPAFHTIEIRKAVNIFLGGW